MLSHTEGINPPTPVGLLTDTQASSSTNASGEPRLHTPAELMAKVWGHFRTPQRRQRAQGSARFSGDRSAPPNQSRGLCPCLQPGQVEGSGLGDCRRVAPLLPRALIHPACTGLNAKS